MNNFFTDVNFFFKDDTRTRYPALCRIVLTVNRLFIKCEISKKCEIIKLGKDLHILNRIDSYVMLLCYF